MNYKVKEIYYTLQGEGANAGRPAVFCRFTGCNLWSGLNADRSRALCQFCDTDFVGTDGPGGGEFESATALASRINDVWPDNDFVTERFVVLTGGEPLLQVDDEIIQALHDAGFEVGVETNGTIRPPTGIDWVCVSPKHGAKCVVRSGHELKFVFPQDGDDPARYEELDFQHFYLQPMDGPQKERNVDLAVEYCLQNPKWRLSLQTHKLIGLR